MFMDRTEMTPANDLIVGKSVGATGATSQVIAAMNFENSVCLMHYTFGWKSHYFTPKGNSISRIVFRRIRNSDGEKNVYSSKILQSNSIQ
jgi:hypothetical protein